MQLAHFFNDCDYNRVPNPDYLYAETLKSYEHILRRMQPMPLFSLEEGKVSASAIHLVHRRMHYLCVRIIRKYGLNHG